MPICADRVITAPPRHTLAAVIASSLILPVATAKSANFVSVTDKSTNFIPVIDKLRWSNSGALICVSKDVFTDSAVNF
ncbi:MAG: hypothetical protein DDT42_02035 [candidate division WS2 bacterium]|uniref:Uncharacterized protein n=1 Tax=Psychracetigena formicireducens TaxID=2986056 RepID=A0A9E2BID9_PSYF1|nr:hypothetical protein [Candidatus Psychracetigena formicireducens]